MELDKHPNSLVLVGPQSRKVLPPTCYEDKEMSRSFSSIGHIKSTVEVLQLRMTVVHVDFLAVHEHFMPEIQMHLPTCKSKSLLEELDVLVHVVFGNRQPVLAKFRERVEHNVHVSILRVVLQEKRKITRTKKQHNKQELTGFTV